MSMMKSKSFLLFFIVFLNSCSLFSKRDNHVFIYFQSNPSGAEICNKDMKCFGKTPLVLKIPVLDKSNNFKMPLMYSRWPSGAYLLISEYEYDLNKTNVWNYKFNRPDNFPGRKEDLDYAVQHERNILLMKQNMLLLKQNEIIKSQGISDFRGYISFCTYLSTSSGWKATCL